MPFKCIMCVFAYYFYHNPWQPLAVGDGGSQRKRKKTETLNFITVKKYQPLLLADFTCAFSVVWFFSHIFF